MDDARRTDAPQRRRAAVALTGREFAVLEFVDVAVAPDGALGGDARLILRHDRKRLHEAVAEIVRQRIAIGVDDVAVRFLHRDVADRGQRSRALVVDNLIGGQNVVVVVDLDVAARDDAVAGLCRKSAGRPAAASAASGQRCVLTLPNMLPFGNDEGFFLFAGANGSPVAPLVWARAAPVVSSVIDAIRKAHAKRAGEPGRRSAPEAPARQAATLVRCPRFTHHSTVLLVQQHRR